jgi:hypothetical protein
MQKLSTPASKRRHASLLFSTRYSLSILSPLTPFPIEESNTYHNMNPDNFLETTLCEDRGFPGPEWAGNNASYSNAGMNTYPTLLQQPTSNLYTGMQQESQPYGTRCPPRWPLSQAALYQPFCGTMYNSNLMHYPGDMSAQVYSAPAIEDASLVANKYKPVKRLAPAPEAFTPSHNPESGTQTLQSPVRFAESSCRNVGSGSQAVSNTQVGKLARTKKTKKRGRIWCPNLFDPSTCCNEDIESSQRLAIPDGFCTIGLRMYTGGRPGNCFASYTLECGVKGIT